MKKNKVNKDSLSNKTLHFIPGDRICIVMFTIRECDRENSPRETLRRKKMFHFKDLRSLNSQSWYNDLLK
jgi:hypothetical protein